MIDYKWPTAGDEPCPLEKDRIGNREIWLYWALEYYKDGWNVIPISSQKKPIVKSWKHWKERRQTFKEIQEMHWEFADGIAGITGVNGYHAIDVDRENLSKAKEFLEKLPKTRVHKTMGGGRHFIFKSRKPSPSTDKWRARFGFELQGMGNYIVLPPSMGGAYKIEDDTDVCEVEDLYELLKNLAKELGWEEPKPLGKTLSRKIEIKDVLGVPCVKIFRERPFPEGSRHNTIAKNFAILLLQFAPKDEEKRRALADEIARIQPEFSPVEINGWERWILNEKARFNCAEVSNYIKGIFEDFSCGGCPSERTEVKKKLVRFATIIDLPDGRHAEEILRNGAGRFAIYDPKTDQVEYLDQIDLGGEIIAPMPVREELRQALTLPDGVEEYGSLVDLRREMLEFASWEFDPGENADLFTLCIHLFLTSWIAAEWLEPMAERYIPIVCARGPSETGKKRLLTVARFLCYRPLYAMKTHRVPSLFRAIAPWRGTLVLDEADIPESGLASEYVQFLNSRADGVPITRYDSDRAKSRWFYSFGMTVLATRKPFTDDGLESRLVVFPSEGTDRPEKYDLLPPQEFVDRGASLQRKLFLFHLRHLKGKVPSQLIIQGVSSFRVREALLLLQALAGEDPELVKDFEKLAKKLEERLIAERAGSPEGLILNVVYSTLDDPETELQSWRDGWQIIRPKGVTLVTHVTPNNAPQEEELVRVPLTLRSVSSSIGKALSPSEVARFWRGLGQAVRSHARIDGKRYRGLLLIRNPRRLRKEFKKYVIDAEDILSRHFPAQTKLEAYNEA